MHNTHITYIQCIYTYILCEVNVSVAYKQHIEYGPSGRWLGCVSIIISDCCSHAAHTVIHRIITLLVVMCVRATISKNTKSHNVSESCTNSIRSNDQCWLHVTTKSVTTIIAITATKWMEIVIEVEPSYSVGWTHTCPDRTQIWKNKKSSPTEIVLP